MTPSFSAAKLRQMSSMVEWCADNAIDVLNRKVETNDGIIDLKQ